MNTKKVIIKFIMWFVIIFFGIIILFISFMYSDRYIRKTFKYDDIVTVIANYENYACENCAHFKILEIDNAKYKHFIGEELSLYSNTIDVEEYWASCVIDSTKLASPKFKITGKLHKFRKNFTLIGDAFEPYCYKFEVLEIKLIRK